ncbi:surface polysaccharide O-acyltransferase-like enzyme [Actinokineospora baliensis]|uniref:acyltransferase family protein n=1 Tax=Actinokineospora baliensis TaxID=547056 RepID=UPI00195DF8C9|nr:acyltransferase [Actinokineospora baliensis]MBM7772215.1 surface polysaccharide O-acyltransferase-like enzyme [Actinokineospora baliensis]
MSRARRDPFLDVIRVGAVLLVVAQHWLMPVLASNGHTVETGNALTTPGWWLLTWLSQVMPVVFFAGGAANLHSYRASTDTRAWLASRLRRLVLPVLPLAAVWVALPHVLLRLGVPPQPVDIAGGISAQLLWFLVVYLVVVALTPLMTRAHDRFGLAVLVPLAVTAVVVDVVRFAGLPEAGFVNAVVIWVAVHQLGLCYTDGRFELGKRAHTAMAVAGFGVVALMVACGPYALSMIGMPGAPMSNMSPPAAVLLPLAVGQLGLLLLARRFLTRLAGPAVDAVAARCTTIYLWHMPALVVVAGIMVVGMGYRTPDPGSLAWFAVAPMWLTCTGLVLTALVRVFGRFETGGGRAVPPSGAVAAGYMTATGGLLGLTVRGFAPDGPALFDGPVPWAVLVLVGVALCTHDRRVSLTRRVDLPAAPVPAAIHPVHR